LWKVSISFLLTISAAWRRPPASQIIGNVKLKLLRIVLLSTYDMGRQPFGLASPAAWLRGAGHHVTCADLAVATLPTLEVREAELIALYVPMHTATRLAGKVLRTLRTLNPRAHLCCFGLYAPLNEEYLRECGAQTVIGGEFEAALVSLADSGNAPRGVVLDRLLFVTPDRAGLPVLQRYPKLVNGDVKRIAGYTEASRGCKHMCRHCPVVPIYGGVFRVVPVEVVLEDVRRQVAAGAEHLTFGDPDFFNGPAHAKRIVEAIHTEFPQLTYDVTIKIEHLLKHANHLAVLKRTGCVFVTSAVESIDDDVLAKLDKGHTRHDFTEAARLMRANELPLAPTFIPFTPWTSLDGYRELLVTIAQLDLIDAVAPVQLALRLLITSGSRLLELEEIQRLIGGFDTTALAYPWRHPNNEVDAAAQEVMQIVRRDARARIPRRTTFRHIWEHVHSRPLHDDVLLPRTVIPYMEEPWFC
jgi:radical SAM superfamily enzyme YgiQ (UPF0313 family)